MEDKDKKVIVDYVEYQGLLKQLENLKADIEVLKSGDNVLIFKYTNQRDNWYSNTISKIKYPFPTMIKGNTLIEEFFKLKNEELDEIIQMYTSHFRCKRCNIVVKKEEEDLDTLLIKNKYSKSFTNFMSKLIRLLNKF